MYMLLPSHYIVRDMRMTLYIIWCNIYDYNENHFIGLEVDLSHGLCCNMLVSHGW